jgi:uncharacterized oligopeptide transporter (OPT) family protein
MSSPTDSGGRGGGAATSSDDGLFQRRYREVTWSAIVLAIVIGVVMNAAITYAGLKIGFTIGGSAIAAVLGFGVLRGLLKKGTILETNIVQTMASAVNTSNSGVIFTVPVLFLIGYKLSIQSVDFWLITLACVAGGLLGTAFIIPLRKQMIDVDRLRFPSPTAVATILKSPGAGAAKAKVLVYGLLLGAAIYVPTQWATIMELFGAEAGRSLAHLPVVGTENGGFVGAETVNVGKLFGLPPQIELIFAIAPFALGAGYLTGRAGLFVLAGGLLAYFLLNPLAFAMGWMPATVTAEKAAAYGFQSFNRPLGVGLLLGGALMGVLFALPAMKEALKSIVAASRSKVGGGDELGLKTLSLSIVGGFLFLFLAADVVGNRPVNLACPITSAAIVDDVPTASHDGYTIGFATADAATAWDGWTGAERSAYLATLDAKPGWLAGFDPHLRALVIALFGAVWIWFAGIIISQCAGMTDWSPISGMALLTVILVLLLAGSGAVVGAVLLGAALCVAITLASDMMGDLKTGHLVGAQPRRQQITELAVVAIGPVVTMLTVVLIANVNLEATGGQHAFGPQTPTIAPQAQALQAVITGVQGGEMPYALYGFGGVLGIILGLGAFSGLGVLVGLSMYLPFVFIATYGVGCLVNMAIVRWKGRAWAEDWGVPFCAGLVVGESILALVLNIFVLLA